MQINGSLSNLLSKHSSLKYCACKICLHIVKNEIKSYACLFNDVDLRILTVAISKQIQRKDANSQRNAKIMENELSYKVIGAAITVHQSLGGLGLLESIYESALFHELTINGLKVERQKPIPVIYKGVVIREPFILDMLVEHKLIIEVKAVEKEIEIYKAQLLTYLRLSNIKLGLLINFGRPSIKEGIHRVVNGL